MPLIIHFCFCSCAGLFESYLIDSLEHSLFNAALTPGQIMIMVIVENGFKSAMYHEFEIITDICKC